MELIDNNGAPSGKKHFVFYNPPIVNKPLNIRRSATLEVRKLAGEFLKNKIQTIVFARSRVRVEIILTYLQELVKDRLGPKSIRGYRGGYLPTERREIEKGLRNGEIYGVVSTNALRARGGYRTTASVHYDRLSRDDSECLAAGRTSRKAHGESL